MQHVQLSLHGEQWRELILQKSMDTRDLSVNNRLTICLIEGVKMK